MTETTLTRQRILEAAEDVLRRFGPDKTTVVDVARGLNVSHGSVYRHFPSKAALRDAVAERWLGRLSAPLEAIVTERGPAIPRLRRWFELLRDAKRHRAQEDPELFATYVQLATDARDVVRGHVDVLVTQVAQMVSDGINRGELAAVDPAVAARALFDATALFHHPAHLLEQSTADTDASFDAVWYVLMNGLSRPPRSTPRRGLPAQRKAAEAKSAAR